MNRTVREIYADYQYEMTKIGLALRDLSLEDGVTSDVVEDLLRRVERTEALIDLYAYLLASQDSPR
jgi:hypothetical protein